MSNLQRCAVKRQKRCSPAWCIGDRALQETRLIRCLDLTGLDIGGIANHTVPHWS